MLAILIRLHLFQFVIFNRSVNLKCTEFQFRSENPNKISLHPTLCQYYKLHLTARVIINIWIKFYIECIPRMTTKQHQYHQQWCKWWVFRLMVQFFVCCFRFFFCSFGPFNVQYQFIFVNIFWVKYAFNNHTHSNDLQFYIFVFFCFVLVLSFFLGIFFFFH